MGLLTESAVSVPCIFNGLVKIRGYQIKMIIVDHVYGDFINLSETNKHALIPLNGSLNSIRKYTKMVSFLRHVLLPSGLSISVKITCIQIIVKMKTGKPQHDCRTTWWAVFYDLACDP